MKSRDEKSANCLELHFPENPTGLPHPLEDYRFVRDWLAGAAAAVELCPAYEATWSTAVARREGAPVEPLSAEELRELTEFNLACGNVGGAALAPALGDRGTLAVVTGQQPNLLVSPLFIVVKAIATVALARRLARATGRRVVPIFWVASDDHDFSELAQCYVLGRSGALRNLAVLVVRHGAFSEASPAFAWNLDGVAPHLVAALRGELAAGRARGATLDAVEHALGAPATFESVFCRLLARYLEHTPLVFVVPRMRWIRQRQRTILEREIEGCEATNRAVAEGGKLMSARGYRPQVHRRLHDLNFFYLLDGVRCRLVQRGKRVQVEHPGKRSVLTSFAFDELAGHAERHWENFSPNVVTRPIVQDAVLPTVAYVAGPAEFTYLAQIRPVYERFGVVPCQPVLRPMITLLSSSGRATLQRLDAWEAFLRGGLGAVVEKIVEGDVRLGQALRRIRENEDIVQRELAELGRDLAVDYPHLAVAFEKTRHHVSHGLTRLRHRMMRQFRPADDEMCRDLCSVFTEVAPMATPQERVLSPLSFGNEIAPAELGTLLEGALEGWEPAADALILGLRAESSSRRPAVGATPVTGERE